MPLILLVALSCVSTSKDYKPKPDESAIVGSFSIVYNGDLYTQGCQAIFESSDEKPYKLDRSGFVALTLPPGRTHLKRVACLDGSWYHYDLEGIEFEARAGHRNYFGKVDIRWKTKGGMKGSAMFGLVGAAVDQSSNDGTLSMTVEDQMDEMTAVYRKKYPKDAQTFHKSLMSVGGNTAK